LHIVYGTRPVQWWWFSVSAWQCTQPLTRPRRRPFNSYSLPVT
jgi:hypothetical protein